MKAFLFFLLVLMAGMLLLQPLLGAAIELNADLAAARAAQMRENTRHDNAMHLKMEQLAGELVELAPSLVYLVAVAISIGIAVMLAAVGVGIALHLHHRGKAIASKGAKQLQPSDDDRGWRSGRAREQQRAPGLAMPPV